MTLALACACACSSGPGSSRPVGPDDPSPSTAATGADGSPQDEGARLGRKDCLAVLDHFLAVMMQEKRESGPPEEMPTEEQLAEIKKRMEGDLETCIGESRVPFECVMTAQSTAAINACLEAKKE